MLKLSLRNILRQKIHTTMSLISIICGVVGIILAGGWVNDIFIQLGEALIHSQSGHIQIYKQGYFHEGSRSPEKYLIYDFDQMKKTVAQQITVEKFDSITARLNFSGLLNNGRSDLPIVGEGIQPENEGQFSTALKITDGRRLTDQDKFGLMLGRGLANGLKLKPGDTVTLLTNTIEGALNSLDFEVIGIFQTFSNDYDARTIKISLATAQELLSINAVNALVISLKETKNTDQITALLKNKLDSFDLEVRTWTELNDFYEKTVDLYKNQFGVLQLIILVMVCLSVANSVNMSIYERTGEFGTMLALGNRSMDVFYLIISENLLLGCIGASLGIAIGMFIALTISAIGIPMPPPPNADLGYIAQIRIVPSVLLLAFLIGLFATVIAAIMPARKIAQLPIVEALRQNY